MTKYIIDEKGLEVISEIHDKDFVAKKDNESKSNDEDAETKEETKEKKEEKSDEVEFEDI